MKEQDLLLTNPHSVSVDKGGVLEAFCSAVCQVSNLKTGFFSCARLPATGSHAQLKVMSKLHYRKTLILGKLILEVWQPCLFSEKCFLTSLLQCSWKSKGSSTLRWLIFSLKMKTVKTSSLPWNKVWLIVDMRHKGFFFVRQKSGQWLFFVAPWIGYGGEYPLPTTR